MGFGDHVQCASLLSCDAHMTAAQYKRLLLLITVPLILLGFWVADEEFLLKQHTTGNCSLGPTGSYFCALIQSRREEQRRVQVDTGGVWLDSAFMSDGFDADVLTEPGSARKHITISRAHAFAPGSYGSCTLSANIAVSLWYLRCWGTVQLNETFRFADPAVATRYANAYAETRSETALLEPYNQRSFWASVLAPLVAFLLLSLIVWLLGKAVRFVRGTPKPAGDGA